MGAPVLAVAALSDGGVVSGHDDGRSVLHRNASRRVLGRQAQGVFSLAVHDSLVAAGSDDRTVRVYDTASAGEPTILTGLRDKVTAMAFLGGRRLVVGSEVGERILMDLDTASPLLSLPEVESSVTALVTWPGQRWVASVVGNRVETWDLDEGGWGRHACTVAGRALATDEVEDFLNGEAPLSEPC